MSWRQQRADSGTAASGAWEAGIDMGKSVLWQKRKEQVFSPWGFGYRRDS
jgi:hypothetical protein